MQAMPRKKEFEVIGRGFIFKRHQEAIEKINAEIKDGSANLVILTPSDCHLEYILKNQGKTILCEKPLIIGRNDMVKLDEIKNLFTCHQLRYAEVPLGIVKDFNYLNIDIKLKRNKEYFQSWKGQKEKSGGILLNNALHYFDWVIHHFGSWGMEYKCCKLTDRLAEGKFMARDYECDWRFEMGEEVENKRVVVLNGKEIDMREGENLHIKLYQDFIKGKGVKWAEVKKIYKLIFDIYEHPTGSYQSFE